MLPDRTIPCLRSFPCFRRIPTSSGPGCSSKLLDQLHGRWHATLVEENRERMSPQGSETQPQRNLSADRCSQDWNHGRMLRHERRFLLPDCRSCRRNGRSFPCFQRIPYFRRSSPPGRHGRTQSFLELGRKRLAGHLCRMRMPVEMRIRREEGKLRGTCLQPMQGQHKPPRRGR